MLHLDNLPDTFDEHLRILERLEGRTIVDLYERVWSIARKSETLPDFDNITIQYVYSNLKRLLTEHFSHLDLDIQFCVNGELSEFLVDDENLDTVTYNAMLDGNYMPSTTDSDFKF